MQLRIAKEELIWDAFAGQCLVFSAAALDENRNCKEPLSWTYPTCNDVITMYLYNTYMYIPLDTHTHIYIYTIVCTHICTYIVHIHIIPCVYIYRCLLILLLLLILFLFAGRSIAGLFNGDHLDKNNYGGGHLGGVWHRHGTTKASVLVRLTVT